MKRIASLIVVLSLFVSCDRSYGKADYPVCNMETTQAQTESGTKHIGSVKLVGKSKRDGVKTISLANGLKSLLVSDGTTIGRQGVDLEVLSLADFKRGASFTITDAMSDGYPWSSNSLAIAPNGSNVLLYNQYIDLNTFQPTIALDIQPVIGRRNVFPIPRAISPNGKVALVCVASYMSGDEATLATFDLKNGKPGKKIASGGNVVNGIARFLDNETVVSIGYDGVVTLHDLVSSGVEIFPEKITPGVIQKGGNLRLLPFDGGKKLVVTGDDEIVVLDISKKSVVFRHACNDGNAVLTNDGKLLMWQKNRSKKTKAYFETEFLLLVANAQTGAIVGEYLLPTFYNMIVLDDASEYIFGAHRNELHKLKIDLSTITKK